MKKRDFWFALVFQRECRSYIEAKNSVHAFLHRTWQPSGGEDLEEGFETRWSEFLTSVQAEIAAEVVAALQEKFSRKDHFHQPMGEKPNELLDQLQKWWQGQMKEAKEALYQPHPLPEFCSSSSQT
ncbi:MAG: hypothetical protein A2722_01600 [Candidatus Doudnabacteria bacterium RIFCSPHIGHO2_01_FULL_50_11]|uniref:Uncharacterized protein n=1 Tax=Candidatus Doudnabacteria bacterium RIFCSPHIGHO2_01_FULL_50_11 TaxID=1817828 RepID=A0A1F5PE81_9BACT|nr:MAG: hypothetical protein A2722_01600 [Candidatus Doudnabacteria bacterium RIFCSPHIGHO2_01_FULL_50_11]HLC44303.1 hypothetical protein [Patescibacteria group bacterium]